MPPAPSSLLPSILSGTVINSGEATRDDERAGAEDAEDDVGRLPPGSAAATASRSEPGPLVLVFVTVDCVATGCGAEKADVPSAATVCVATILELSVTTEPATASDVEEAPTARVTSPRKVRLARAIHVHVQHRRGGRGSGQRQPERRTVG